MLGAARDPEVQQELKAPAGGYSRAPAGNTSPPTIFQVVPPVFSREATLAILATHGVLVARVPLHPRPSACRRVRPHRFVCQLAPLHGWHSPGRRWARPSGRTSVRLPGGAGPLVSCSTIPKPRWPESTNSVSRGSRYGSRADAPFGGALETHWPAKHPATNG